MNFFAIKPAAAAPLSRGLDLQVERVPVDEGERLCLRLGGGEVLATFSEPERWVVTSGSLSVEAPDDARGAAFAEGVGRWLEVDLMPTDALADRSPVECSYAGLGHGKGKEGQEWEVFKLFFASYPDSAELFLRVSPDRKRAQFVEKDTSCREKLVEMLDRALRRRGPPRAAFRASRRIFELTPTKDGAAIVLDLGLRLELPRGWTAAQVPEGFVKCVDPTDECLLEVSSMRLPALAPGAPDLAERLRSVLTAEVESARDSPMNQETRGNIRVAWTDYPYDSDDPKRNVKRPARGRWLVAEHRNIQALLTFYYWVDDAPWAVAAWERIAGSLTFLDA